MRTEVIASSGERAPAVIRVCSRLTSSSSAAKRRVKKAMASSVGTSGHLADAALTLGGADIDGAVRVHPAEGCGVAHVRPALRHASILPDTLACVLVASFPAGPWQTNTYVVATDRGSECVVIDPGMDAEAGVADLVAEHRLKPVAVMVTHGHLDHMFAVAPLCRANEAPCWVHPDDRDLLADPLRSMGAETRALLAQLAPGHSGLRRAGRGP